MEGILDSAPLFLFSLLGLIVALRLRLPTVIGILLAGVLVGPNLFGYITYDKQVEVFSNLGAILLLFVIGLEFSLNKIMKFGVRAILIAFLKITFVFVICYQTSILLGLKPTEAVITGSIFAITSTTLFSKLIKNNPEKNKDEVNLMFAVLILEDVFAVFFLTIISGLSNNTSLDLSEVVISIVKSLIVLAGAYLILQKLLKIFFDYVLRYKTDETLVFSSLSVCLIFSFIASFLGFEASIGAFLAGSLMSSLSEFKKIEKTILPFGLFFSSFFFLSIGMQVNLSSIAANFGLIIILLGVSFIAKFLSVGIGTYLLGYTSRSAVFSGLTMLTVGEFSLLIASKSKDIVSYDILGVVSVSVFISAIVSVFIMRRESQIDATITDSIPHKFRNTGRHVSRYINSVINEFEPTGRFYKITMSELKKAVIYVVGLLIVNGTLFIGEHFLESTKILSFDENPLFLVRIAIHLILSLAFLIGIMKSADIVIIDLIDSLRQTNKNPISLERRVVYDALTVLILLGIAALVPILVSVVHLPVIFSHLSTLMVIVSIIFTWDAFKTLHLKIKSIGIRRRTYNPRIKPLSRLKKLRSLAMFLNI